MRPCMSSSTSSRSLMSTATARYPLPSSTPSSHPWVTRRPRRLQKMVREVDADGDGCISFEEFVELNTRGVDSDKIMENLKEAFSVYDKDGNGEITAEELHEVLMSLGEECTLGECRKMINGVDREGDSMISFEEFKVMMAVDSRMDVSYFT
ncbi:hypothetical protein MLD38_011371 [Melastoma candidum]|uniref:Uncharacterized protein n=1 Tax=Melastoma candidum TaxID=119954 RepID=A0ACB9R5U7_9MYRT|nr:hypothetical protein MLD38_011371 [Melastoma candidum]